MALAFFGCSEDWLELELKGSLPFSSESIDTEEKVFEVLCGAYDMLQAKYYAGQWSSYYLIGNLTSGDAVPVGGGFSDRPEYWDLYEFEPTPENTALEQFWRRDYYGIYRANIVINEITISTPKVKQYQGEAKFLRAYYYFELVRAFGNVAFYTENLAPSEYKATNTDKSIIYAQIEKDLIEAIQVLPEKSDQSRAELSQASKGAAKALLGKVYLFQEKYNEAATILDEVITSDIYDLIPVYDSIFLKSEEFGVESVFEIPYMSYYHGDAWSNGRESEGNIDVQLTGARETAIGDVYNAGWGFDMIDSNLIDAFDASGDDIRKYGTGYGPELFKQTITVDPSNDINNNGFPDNKEKEGWTGWYQKKRAPIPGYNNPSQSTEWTYDNNERIIRFSDVLLMAAEAHNRTNNDTKALEYVNRVRERVELSELSSSGDQLFEDIKLERRLELAMEGHRFYDLVRWGDAENELGRLGFQKGKNEIFPIPLSEIGLTNLTQNPGY
jgi:hypothetical protein